MLVLFLALVGSLVVTPQVSALSSSDFQPGHIIDDGVFFNGSSLSAQDVQLFLNSKVPICDTNGTQAYGGTTRAAYGATHGNPAPYTCLKNYRQDTPAKLAETGLCNAITAGNRSAAEIIYEIGQKCGVSQSILITLLEKEQSLITDDWPWTIQYRSATGYGCPDTAPCDSEYYGFFNQVYNAARQFKRYSRDESSFRYRAFRTNSIQYNPNAICGASDVFIQNQATAGLYNYTPYQPNTAALANLGGSGDSCSAYGNRNFWKLYNDWFGSTLSGEFSWRVIRTATDSRLYLQVGNTKRWIPTGDLYHDWKLDTYPVNTLSDDSFNSIPTIPELTRLGNNGQYNYLVENGRRHYISNDNLLLWGYQNTIAAPVNTLLSAIPENEPVGRFILSPEANATYSYWVMDNGSRHSIAPADLATWGYSISNVVGIGQTYLTYIPISAPVSRNIQISGSSYVVDQNSLIKVANAATQAAWQRGNYVPISTSAGSYLKVRATANFLVRANNSPDWYLLDGGMKYYVPSGNMAMNWGANPASLIVVSPELLAQFTTASGNLSSIAKDANSQQVFLLDGQKHYIGSNALLTTLQAPTTAIVTTSSLRLSDIPTGSDYTKPFVIMRGTPDVYLLDKGMRYFVSSGGLYDAYNAWSGPQSLSSTLLTLMPYPAEPLSGIFKDNSENTYLADTGSRTIISSSVADGWRPTTAVPLFSNELLSLLPVSGRPSIDNRYVTLAGVTYIMDAGSKLKIADGSIKSYITASTPIIETNNILPTRPGSAGFLVKSTEDQKFWFINQGSKINIDFATAVSFGYLSAGVQPASLTNTFLTTIPTSTQKSLLIREQNSGGVKFVNFGSSLGFPDGATLYNTAGAANPIIVVDNATYDSFPLAGSITRIVKDDTGKLYLLDSGKRRWITNWQAFQPYTNIPITYLFGTTMALIPEGTPIN